MAGVLHLDDLGPGAKQIRIDNPGKYNAMSLSMWRELGETVRALGQDAQMRVLVLRGDGEKAFMSGADISEFDTTRTAQTGSEQYDQAVEEAQKALQQAPFPVMAAIRGVCMGGGLGLAVACDLRYCTKASSFRMPAARLGLGYSYVGIRQMVDAIGAARTSELFFTARRFDGAEAERIGLVHACFDDEGFEDAVQTVVGQVSENAPLTVRLAKAAISLATSDVGAGGHAVGIERARQRCTRSEDYAEGRRAFAEKRAPVFKGF
ncbi:enoyl-CoA hydratase [Xenophilus azovorans]|uniref:enoyl-CoA hydratase n=1 Tax=Xenophilus azovorans TaxID=151755 RepID=UPI000570FEA7|nr:enoyl-CoA hydratase [Xenophilus azovorans]